MSSRISTLANQIKENPKDSFLKFALALELLKTGNTNKALALFRNIRETEPDYVGVYYHLGKLYEELGENNFAIESYNQGIEVAEKLSDTHAKSELQSALINLEMELG